MKYFKTTIYMYILSTKQLNKRNKISYFSYIPTHETRYLNIN